MPYRKQLARKQTAIEELFAPLMDAFGWDVAPDAVRGMGARAGDSGRAAAPRGFRCKVTTPFAPGPSGAVLSGLFAAGTHEIVPVASCPVEAAGARDLLNRVASLATELGIPAYDEDARRGQLRYAVARKGWRTGEGLLTIVTANRDVARLPELAERLRAEFPGLVGVAQNVNPHVGNAVLGSETVSLSGRDRMRDALLSCTFEISPTAFYQTNPAQTEVLYRLAIDGMALGEGDVLLDAYCGSGTIGLCAAAWARDAGRPISLIGVERNPAGVADAERNALLNGFRTAPTAPDEEERGADRAAGDRDAGVAFVADDATSYIGRLAAAGARVDVLCLDPPRAGSTPAFLKAACALAPRRIVYVSCNPETQVRDLGLLGASGYRLVRLTPVDLFPHTPHIETVAVLERP